MSVKLNKDGPRILREAYKRKGLSQYEWARQAGYTEIVVKNLLRIEGGGPVSQEALERLCEVVEVNWQDVVEDPPIDPLLAEVREKHRPYLIEKHGKIRVLDMEQPIGLDDVFIEVKILEKLTKRLHLSRKELMDQANHPDHDFERWGFGRVLEEGLSGLDALKKFQKLVVLGKPGSGKTTFLRRVAILNIHGHFLPDHVPVFIPLADFAADRKQPSLLDYIIEHWQNRGGISPETTKELLRRGRVLVLLDGLDEVKEADSERVIRSVEAFTHQFMENHFAITCRIAAREYTFKSFTEVEVADFKDAQIKDFADKWFSARRDKHKTCKSAEEFLQQLEAHPRMQQLATSPLLLTLLCLVFEDSGRFMESRADLYKEGIDLLLFKWDSREHNLQRPRVYSGLGPRRIRSLLGQIAKDTLEREEKFFRERHIECWIGDFIRNLPEAKTDPEALRVDSHQVLESIGGYGLLIERSQKLWSFSHLTFHEYFAADAIAERCNPDMPDDPVLNQLVSHLCDRRWREVFLLTSEMLVNADKLLLLMKRKTDALIAETDALQSMLNSLSQRSCDVKSRYKPAGIRAFDIEGAMDNYNPHVCARDKSLEDNLSLEIILLQIMGIVLYNHDLSSSLSLGVDTCIDRIIEPLFEEDFPREIDYGKASDRYELWQNAELDTDVRQISKAIEKASHPTLGNPELKQALQQLQDKLPDDLDENNQEWLKTQSAKDWGEELRQVIIKYRGIGHDWQGQFTPAERQLLKSYYNANALLARCLNGNSVVSPHVRQEIEDTLLLPDAEIKARS
ncbi:MAG: NACHT domain-containing NTPase [Hormoscilla sp.]